MTCDDTIKMAREVGYPLVEYEGTPYIPPLLAVLLETVRADERKRLHDKFMEIHKSQQHSNNYWHFAARKIMEET